MTRTHDEGESALALAAELRERVNRERQAVRALQEHLLTRNAIGAESQVGPAHEGGEVGGGEVVLEAPGSAPLSLVTRGVPPFPVCAVLEGEVDADVVPWVRQVLVDLVDAGPAGLALDLSGVSFMDSAGLGALLHVRRWALASERGFEVVGVSPELRRLLRITGLHTVLLPDDLAG